MLYASAMRRSVGKTSWQDLINPEIHHGKTGKKMGFSLTLNLDVYSATLKMLMALTLSLLF